MNLFSSLTILDLTRVFSGPFATRHFADFGANVIKIEPQLGDDSRHFQPLVNGASGYFEILNRNKKSIALDLKNPSDLEKLYQLVQKADVLVENYSPEIKNKLKIDYFTISQINPRIIYASLSGISENINRKYYDVIAQAESGFISLNGEDKDMKVATAIMDAFAGAKLAFAISSALYSREQTGHGMKLNVSMRGSGFDLLEQNLIEASITSKNPPKVGNMDSAIAPFGIFAAQDKSIVLAIGNDTQWQQFVNLFSQYSPDLISPIYAHNSLRVNNITQLKTAIETAFSQYLAAVLIEKLSSISIPCGEIKTMLDVLNDPVNYEQNLLEKFNHPQFGPIVTPTGGIFFDPYPKESYKPAPELNQDKDYEI